MNWPQIIMWVLMGFQACYTISNHGRPKGEYHIGYTTADILTIWIILDQGGFWK